ncbi:hypothetical protein Chor_011517 [Crotalus horridus]
MAVQGGYTILIIPLGTALSNLHALRFFIWLKQMQQLERERDALLQGLEMVNQPEVPLKSWRVPFSSPENPFHQQAILVLKEQNHLLTKEVSQKCHRIAQLEEEKASLCKQLKESWGYKLPSHKEFTFI